MALAAILLIDPENGDQEGFCSSLCKFSIFASNALWRSTCDHDYELCGGRSERYQQSRYDHRGEGPLTARVEHISPIGSLFVKLSPPIIQVLISECISPSVLWMSGASCLLLGACDEETDSGSPSSWPSRAGGELLELLAPPSSSSGAELRFLNQRVVFSRLAHGALETI